MDSYGVSNDLLLEGGASLQYEEEEQQATQTGASFSASLSTAEL
jgi:hypothetical protein